MTLQVIHTSVGVERHAYRWWLEAATAANLEGMFPQGGSVQDIAGVKGHTYQCRSRVTRMATSTGLGVD